MRADIMRRMNDAVQSSGQHLMAFSYRQTFSMRPPSASSSCSRKGANGMYMEELCVVVDDVEGNKGDQTSAGGST